MYRTMRNPRRLSRVRWRLDPLHGGDAILGLRPLRPQIPALACGIYTKRMLVAARLRTQDDLRVRSAAPLRPRWLGFGYGTGRCRSLAAGSPPSAR